MISHALNMENMGKKLFEAGSHVVPTVLDLIYVTQYDLEPLTFCFSQVLGFQVCTPMPS